VIVALVLAALAVVVTPALLGGAAEHRNLAAALPGGTVFGVLQGAGLLFFAFAGYARLATLGEEVVDPDDDDPAGHPDRARHRRGGLRGRAHLGAARDRAQPLADSSAPLAAAVAAAAGRR
jgi:basic amino acid/polyamine antiporter, APA family